jgi:hypothetical protein
MIWWDSMLLEREHRWLGEELKMHWCLALSGAEKFAS